MVGWTRRRIPTRGRATGPRERALPLRLQIELVYDPGCPNVARAREVLTRACRLAQVPAVWSEWNTEDPDCPDHAQNLGSPTILVNGQLSKGTLSTEDLTAAIEFELVAQSGLLEQLP